MHGWMCVQWSPKQLNAIAICRASKEEISALFMQQRNTHYDLADIAHIYMHVICNQRYIYIMYYLPINFFFLLHLKLVVYSTVLLSLSVLLEKNKINPSLCTGAGPEDTLFPVLRWQLVFQWQHENECLSVCTNLKKKVSYHLDHHLFKT